MKFKNSYILLMAMTILLLVSIGSACASDDVSADSTQIAAADESVVQDIVGNGTDDVTPEETTQKAETSITADNNLVYNQKDTGKNITNVDVKDNESTSVENITKDNLTVTENGKNIAFDYNNSVITIKGNLEVGIHVLNITYKGNDLYNSSNILINFTIIKDNYLEVPEIVSGNTTVEIPIKLTDGVNDNTNLLNSTNTQVILKYGEGNETVAVDWSSVAATNKFTVDVTGKIPATVVINYTENGRSVVKTVKVKYQTTTQVTPTVVDINDGDNATFTVIVIGADGNPINITGANLTTTGAQGASTVYNRTSQIMTISGLKKGIHNITITFKGNNINDTSKANVIINVHGAIDINTNGTAIIINSTQIGEIQIINITDGVNPIEYGKDNLTLKVTYKDGNETKEITITEWNLTDGVIRFALENGNFTTATLNINYDNNISSRNVTLNRKYNVKVIPINNVTEYQSGNFTFKVIDLDTNEALVNKSITLQFKIVISSITILNSISATTDEQGIVTFNNSKIGVNLGSLGAAGGLEVGNHTVTLSGTGLNVTNPSQNVTITKIDINIEIITYREYYGSQVPVEILVTNANTGDPIKYTILNLEFDELKVNLTVSTNQNGTAKLNVSSIVGGIYKIKASNNDTKNMNATQVNGTFTIVKIPVVINTNDVTIYYNSGTTATIKVTRNGKPVAGMYLMITLYQSATESRNYLVQTNSNGLCMLTDSLNVGRHRIIVQSADNRYSATKVTKTITVVKANGAFTANAIKAYYRGGYYFTIVLKNTKNKKPIFNAKVNIRVYISSNRYYNYVGNTGLNGQIKLALDSYKPGTYKVEVRGADSKNYAAKQVNSKIVVVKAPTKFIVKKVTAKKGQSKYFNVGVKNSKTNKIIPLVNIKVKVFTGKTYKIYTVKTNKKGIAQLNVKGLAVGTHKVVIASGNPYCVAKAASSAIVITK